MCCKLADIYAKNHFRFFRANEDEAMKLAAMERARLDRERIDLENELEEVSFFIDVKYISS